MPTVLVDLTSYPTISTITNLVRSDVRDDMAGATNTLGEGQILVDNLGISVTMANFFNSAVRELCRQLRLQNAPMLIRDNYIISNIPPMNGPQGFQVADPAVQVAIGQNGYFDGTEWHGAYRLPSDVFQVVRCWERQGLGSGETSTEGGQINPLYFRVRCAITSGTVSVAMSAEPSGDSTSLNATGTEIALVSLSGQTSLDISVSFDEGTGIVYFEASADGDVWYPATPASAAADYSADLSLPLSPIAIPSSETSPPTGASTDTFADMGEPSDGMAGVYQGQGWGRWEWRNDMVWTPGSLDYRDLRIRYLMLLQAQFVQNANPATTYLPILDCEESIARKIGRMYARRQGGGMYQIAAQEEKDATNDFLNEQVHRKQGTNYQTLAYGSEAPPVLNFGQ